MVDNARGGISKCIGKTKENKGVQTFKNVQNQMKSTVNGTLSQGIYQPRNVNYSNVDLYRNNPVQSSGVNNSFGCHNNYQTSNGNAQVVRFSENLDMDSRGFSEDKQDVCKILFVDTEKYYPILCNQENFLLKGNNYKIKQCLPNARVIFKEAIKDSFEGRPKNRMFVAIPLEIKELVIDVSPTHWRVQAIILSTPSNKVLIINSYFPTDSRGNEFDTTDLFSTLSAINSAVENEYDFCVTLSSQAISADL